MGSPSPPPQLPTCSLGGAAPALRARAADEVGVVYVFRHAEKYGLWGDSQTPYWTFATDDVVTSNKGHVWPRPRTPGDVCGVDSIVDGSKVCLNLRLQRLQDIFVIAFRINGNTIEKRLYAHNYTFYNGITDTPRGSTEDRAPLFDFTDSSWRTMETIAPLGRKMLAEMLVDPQSKAVTNPYGLLCPIDRDMSAQRRFADVGKNSAY